MSRSRNIKPGFFKNDVLAECDPLARLLFAGLWCEADRAGRLEDRPKKIRAACLPYDACDIDFLLGQLESHGFILRYIVDGTPYIQVLAFDRHQNPHKNEAASTIPAPELHSTSTVQVPNSSEALRLIPDSLNLIPDSLLVAAPASQDAKPPAVKKDRSITFTSWVRSIPDGEAGVPDDHHVFAYADKVGLPRDYLELAWDWFEDRYSTEAKRYTDWPTVFAKAVKGNWGKIWWIDGDGKYALTTSGKQLLTASKNEALKRVDAA